MAQGERRTEVRDSDDEPMTSSPVDVSDGAADKLSKAPGAPLQDTQDAPQEAAHAHQAPAESAANSPRQSADGLDVDQENASTNDLAPESPEANAQSKIEGAASTEAQASLEVHQNPATSFPQDLSAPKGADVPGVASQLGAVTASGASSSEEEGAQAITKEHLVTTNPSSDVTQPAIEGASYSDRTVADNLDADTAATTFTARPDEVKQTENILVPTKEEQPATRVVVDSPDQDDMEMKQDEVQPSESNALPEVECPPEDSPQGSASSPEAPSSPAHHTSTSRLEDGDRDFRVDVVETSTYKTRPHDPAGGAVAEPSAAPTKNSDPISHRDDNSMDVEMIDVVQTTHEPETSVATSSSCPDELHASTKTTSANTEQRTQSPESNPITGNDAQLPLHAPESLSGTQDEPGQTDASLRKATEEAKVAADAVTPQQASEKIPSVTEQEPKTDQTDASKPTKSETPAIPKTPQEITLAELKAQKAALLVSLATLPAIRILMEEQASSHADESDEPTESDVMAAANKIVKDHIKLLHEYNELKDVGQGLMGLIADQRGVRIIEVQEEFGVDEKD